MGEPNPSNLPPPHVCACVLGNICSRSTPKSNRLARILKESRAIIKVLPKAACDHFACLGGTRVWSMAEALEPPNEDFPEIMLNAIKMVLMEEERESFKTWKPCITFHLSDSHWGRFGKSSSHQQRRASCQALTLYLSVVCKT